MNFQAIICGPPGCGKTTLAKTLVARHLTETRGIVLAFDPMNQFTSAGCEYYADANAWRAKNAAAGAEGREVPRGASIGGNAEDVTRLAMELGKRNNRANDVRLPILIPYDEGSLLGSSGTTYVGELDNQLQATRRHIGVSPIYNLQQPSQLTERFWTMSTDVFLFRQTTDRARQLEQYVLLERGELARAGITRLPAHHYIHVRVGYGIVRGGSS
jgi:energy-coupling factor transporter ATP-binding protein EcfA2